MRIIRACFTLTLTALLLFACGNRASSSVENTTATLPPVGWEVVNDRHNYLPDYEQHVNNHPRISMPLQKVYTQSEGTTNVYRGIVVGEKADKAREAVIAQRGKENCELFKATSAELTLMICRSPQGAAVNYFFHEASPTETYVYTTLDSIRNDYEPAEILSSFIAEITKTHETQ